MIGREGKVTRSLSEATNGGLPDAFLDHRLTPLNEERMYPAPMDGDIQSSRSVLQ